MKEFSELVDYKITEGSDYGWGCYGNHAYQLSSWNGLHDKGGWSFNIVFSTKSQKVFEVSVCDYTNNRAYRMIHPDKIEKYRKEAKSKSVLANQAWDDVDFIDLEVDDDFISKCQAIKAGEPYDTRVEIEFDLEEDLQLQLMKMAHDRDITLNQMVEKILQEMINRPENV
jgi:predicted HicB family RNase H-like nuclease